MGINTLLGRRDPDPPSLERLSQDGTRYSVQKAVVSPPRHRVPLSPISLSPPSLFFCFDDIFGTVCLRDLKTFVDGPQEFASMELGKDFDSNPPWKKSPVRL